MITNKYPRKLWSRLLYRKPVRLKGTPPKLLLATPLVVPGFPSYFLKAEDLKHTSKVIGATRVVKPGPSLGEILLIVWDSVCAVWRAIRTGLVLLPCLLAVPLALIPPPLPRLSRQALAELMAVCAEVAGPVYVKLAQWAATRRDLLPESVCQTLARLQTRVSPHSWRATERLLKEEFGSEFDDFYQRLWLEERRPVASGCCAQVYHGWLDGQEVAIKVVHPNLKRQLQLDIMVMRTTARCLTWLFPSTSWLNMCQAVEEFDNLMTEQMDMVEEAANLTRFRHNFKDTVGIIFPEPILSKRRVLVESWVSGVSIATFLEPGSDPKIQRQLANRGADMLLQMVFHDNLWHGDLHPGNLLVTPSGDLGVLDSGITCSLTREDRANLIDTFRAVVLSDGARVGELFLERSSHACRDRQGFIREMQETVSKARKQQLCLETIDVSLLLQEVFSTLMRHQVKLDASFLSLVIAVAVVEGLGRSLDSELDLVARAMPYVMSPGYRNNS